MGEAGSLSSLPVLPGTPGFELGPGARAAEAALAQAGGASYDSEAVMNTLAAVSDRWWFKALCGVGVYGGLALIGWLADPGPVERAKREYEGQIVALMQQLHVPDGMPIHEFEGLAEQNGIPLPQKPAVLGGDGVDGGADDTWAEGWHSDSSDDEGFGGADSDLEVSGVQELDDSEDDEEIERNMAQRRQELQRRKEQQEQQHRMLPSTGGASPSAGGASEPKSRTMPPRVSQLLQQAGAARRAQQVDQVIELIEAAIMFLSADPDFGAKSLEVALLNFQLGMYIYNTLHDYKRSLEFFSEACQIIETDPETRERAKVDDPLEIDETYLESKTMMCDTLAKTGKRQEAIKQLKAIVEVRDARMEAALGSHPRLSNPQMRSQSGQLLGVVLETLQSLYMQEELFKESIEVGIRAVSMLIQFHSLGSPLTMQSMLRLGNAYMHTRDLKQGEAVFQKLRAQVAEQSERTMQEHQGYNKEARFRMMQMEQLMTPASMALEQTLIEQFFASALFDNGAFEKSVTAYSDALRILNDGREALQSEIDVLQGSDAPTHMERAEIMMHEGNLVQLDAQRVSILADLCGAMDAVHFDARPADRKGDISPDRRDFNEIVDEISEMVNSSERLGFPTSRNRLLRIIESRVLREGATERVTVKAARRDPKGPVLLDDDVPEDPLSIDGVGNLPQGAFVELVVREIDTPLGKAEPTANDAGTDDEPREASSLSGDDEPREAVSNGDEPVSSPSDEESSPSAGELPSPDDEAEDGDKVFSMEEVANHNTPDDCWVVIDGGVYDVTNFLDDHPGGPMELENVAGKDASAEFEDIGHSGEARVDMSKYKVGILAKAEAEPASEAEAEAEAEAASAAEAEAEPASAANDAGSAEVSTGQSTLESRTSHIITAEDVVIKGARPMNLSTGLAPREDAHFVLISDVLEKPASQYKFELHIFADDSKERQLSRVAIFAEPPAVRPAGPTLM